jgi:hypothetical protein
MQEGREGREKLEKLLRGLRPAQWKNFTIFGKEVDVLRALLAATFSDKLVPWQCNPHEAKTFDQMSCDPRRGILIQRTSHWPGEIGGTDVRS